jgi:hypothetical protein
MAQNPFAAQVGTMRNFALARQELYKQMLTKKAISRGIA